MLVDICGYFHDLFTLHTRRLMSYKLADRISRHVSSRLTIKV